MGRRYHVSFICSGNICRSPIAEKVFAREVEQAGLADRVRVTSAGTGSWHVGDPADARAAALLAEHGYDDTHVAQQIDDELLDADLLVALDAGHLRALRRIAPDYERIRLLREFDPDAPAGAGVPDPYYGGPEGFTEVLTMTPEPRLEARCASSGSCSPKKRRKIGSFSNGCFGERISFEVKMFTTEGVARCTAS